MQMYSSCVYVKLGTYANTNVDAELYTAFPVKLLDRVTS